VTCFRSALTSTLYQLGPDRFEEATLYIVRYGLFTDALRIYKDEPKRLQVCVCFHSDV
jgi:acetoacetate decarboxylase